MHRVSAANLLSTMAKESSAYEIFSTFPAHAICLCQVTLLMPRKMISSFVLVSLSAQGHTAVQDNSACRRGLSIVMPLVSVTGVSNLRGQSVKCPPHILCIYQNTAQVPNTHG